MDITTLEKRLEIWKHILLINLGAAFTLLATCIDIPHIDMANIPGWFGIWFIILLASLFPGFILLLGKHWMQLFFGKRLNTIFGYFAIAWVNLFTIGIRMGLNLHSVYPYFLFVSAVAIAVGYWLERRNILQSRGEIFP
jgi:hypothetical protein